VAARVCVCVCVCGCVCVCVCVCACCNLGLGEALLSYLLRWVRQCAGFEPSGKIARAIDFVCEYLNGAFVDTSAAASAQLPGALALPRHICAPGCFCRAVPNPRAELARAFRMV
jgi:hypothetical protein